MGKGKKKSARAKRQQEPALPVGARQPESPPESQASMAATRARNEKYILISAQVKIARMINADHEFKRDLERLRDAMDLRLAAAVLKAEDNVFEDVTKIRNLTDPLAENPSAEANPQRSDFRLTDEMIADLNKILEKKPAGDPDDMVQMEYEEAVKDFERHVESFRSTLEKIRGVKDRFPSGAVKKMLLDSEYLIDGLMNCYMINEKVVEVNTSKNSKKKKEIPATKESDYVFEPRLNQMVNALGEVQDYDFSFPEEDGLLSVYVPAAKELDIQGNIRLYNWVMKSQEKKCLHHQSEDRDAFMKLVKKATDANTKLEALSYLLAYLDPCYNKNDGPYNEQRIMELILLDQFPKLKPLPGQLEDIIKLKEKERNRRLRSGESLLEEMIKPFAYIDMRCQKLRSYHKMSRFYFYLLGFIANEVVPLTRLFLSARDITLRMVENVHKTCRQLKDDTPEQSNEVREGDGSNTSDGNGGQPVTNT